MIILHIFIILYLLFFIEFLCRLFIRLFIKSFELRDIDFGNLRVKLNLSIYKYSLDNNFRRKFYNRRFEINKLRIKFEIEFDIVHID